MAVEGNLRIESYIRVTGIAHAIKLGWNEAAHNPDYLPRLLSESFPELSALELKPLIRQLYSNFLEQFGTTGLTHYEYIAIHLYAAAKEVETDVL